MKWFERFVEIVWGDADGWLGKGGKFFKIAFCILFALLLHQGSLILLKSKLLAYAESELPSVIKLVNTNLAMTTGVKICLQYPIIKGTVACPKNMKSENYQFYQDVDKRWVSFLVVLKNKEQPGHYWDVVFAGDKQLFSTISNPTVIDSFHSFSRIVERASVAKYKYDKDKQNDPGTAIDATTKLKLCAGTRKLMREESCTAIKSALAPLAVHISTLTNWARILALVFGSIQVLTLATFVYVVVEAFGLRLRWLGPDPVLFLEADFRPENLLPVPNEDVDVEADEDAAQNVEGHAAVGNQLMARRQRILTGDNLENAIDGLSGRPRIAPGDSLYLRLLVSLRGGEIREKGEMLSTVAESYREFQISEMDGELAKLDVASEIMLKLAFAGTILGIGTALFLSRGLETMDPIEKVITKSDMFSGIGVAFGTTLVGVILSIIASVIIQSVNSTWGDLVNRYYRIVVDLDREELSTSASNLSSKAFNYIRERNHRSLRRKSSLEELVTTFGTYVLIGLVIVAMWIFRVEIIQFFENLS